MSTPNDRSVHLNQRRRQARQWLVIRQPHRALSAVLQKKWERWTVDRKNLTAFREYERLDKLLRALPPQPLPTEAELRAHFSSSTSKRNPAHARLIYAVAAFAVVTVIGLLLGPRMSSLMRPVQPQIFQTASGQQRTVTLRDHSVIQLGGATRLSVLFSEDTRRITLYDGEAMLNVTHNSRAPFQVDVETTRVTALGTAFHVRRYTDRQVSVEVAEGAVAVAPRGHDAHNMLGPSTSEQLQPITVKAGQEINADATGQITPPHPADFQAVAWWLYGRRVYREKPLGQVIEDLQLYFPRRIEYNPALDTLPFNGIIDPSKPEESIRGLQEVFPIEIDDSDPQRVIIRCRHPNCR